jgi:hypothetical protein
VGLAERNRLIEYEFENVQFSVHEAAHQNLPHYGHMLRVMYGRSLQDALLNYHVRREQPYGGKWNSCSYSNAILHLGTARQIVERALAYGDARILALTLNNVCREFADAIFAIANRRTAPINCELLATCLIVIADTLTGEEGGNCLLTRLGLSEVWSQLAAEARETLGIGNYRDLPISITTLDRNDVAKCSACGTPMRLIYASQPRRIER